MSSKCQNDIREIKTMDFLPFYEKQECLWNPVLSTYKNKNARDDAYKTIIRDMKNSSLTVRDIKLKIKSIRTTYTKELRLQTKLKEQGKPYSPKLFWFNRADMFLKNVSLSRDKRSSLTLEKQKPAHEEEQLSDATTPGSAAATTCIIKLSAPMRDETIMNETNNADTQSKNKDQQHDQQNQSQQQVNPNVSLYIQQPNSHNQQQQQQQQPHQQQQPQQQQHPQQEHNTSKQEETDNRNCIRLTQAITVDNIVNDDNTNDVAGGENDHDESSVNHIIESPRLPDKTDDTSQNEVYNYCTNDTNASSNMITATVNVASNTSNEHNRGEIGSTGYQSYNNTATYVDSSGLDEYDHFCRSIAAQIRRIQDPYSRAYAKLKIQESLFEAETGNYRMNQTSPAPDTQNINNNL